MIDRKPYYIGITGVTSEKGAAFIASQAKLVTLPQHQIMAGILVSSRTFEHQNPAVDRFVRPEDLASLTKILKESTLPMIHYRTRNRNTLGEQLMRLFDQDDIYLDGLCQTVQINRAWPPLEQLELAKKQMPQLRIAICLTPGTVTADNRADAVKQLKDYQPYMDHIVIDPSGGKGKQIDPLLAAAFYRAISHNIPDVPITLTGGLNGQNISKMLSQLQQALGTKDFSIDAESGLRIQDPNKRKFTMLSPEKVTSFLQTAAEFFK